MSPLNITIGTILITDENRQASLDAVSLSGHDVVVATGNPRNYKLPADGRWASSVVIPVGGALCNFFGMVPPTGVDVDIQYIWSPAAATGADIFGADSIILHITGTMADGQLNVSLLSDWDDVAYPFGIGAMTFTNLSFTFIRYVCVLKDNVYGLEVGSNPYTPDFPLLNGTNLQIATYHRPLKNNIPRRLHIINNMTVDWFFDGLSIWGVTDDRTPDRDATGSCPVVFAENRGTIAGEPFLIDGEFDELEATGTHLSIRRLNDTIVNGFVFEEGIRWTGRSLAVRASTKRDIFSESIDAPAQGTVVDEEIWIDTIEPDIIYRLEFGPTEILTVESDELATVLCEANLKVYRDGWMPTTVTYGMTNETLFETMEELLEQIDFEFPLAAWDRGELPMITIEPGPSPGTITANASEGTSSTWTAPEIITARKFKWNGTGWIAQNQYQTTTLDRILVIKPATLPTL